MMIDGIGVLFRGPPGCGKSELALELLRRGHRLVADDLVILCRRGDTLIGTSVEQARGSLAVRGLGILDTPALFGHDAVCESAPVDTIVDLGPPSAVPGQDDLLGHPPMRTVLDSVTIPKLILTGAPGSIALPTRAECLIRQFALQTGGPHTAAKAPTQLEGSPEAWSETCD